MEIIKIKEIVEYAYTYEEGQRIYELIAPSIAAKQSIILSFEGINAVPSSFMNSALLQLCDNFSFEQIKSYLIIKDSNHLLNEMIIKGFESARAKSKQNPS